MRICVPITATTTKQFITDIKKVNKSEANIMELRLDFVKDLNLEHFKEILEATKIPTIVTIRLKAEGGHWDGTDKDRLPYFDSAIKSSIEYLDVEYDSLSREEVAKMPRKETQLIFSYHDLKGTPQISEIHQMYANMHQNGADIAKIVTTAQSTADNWAIYQVLSSVKPDTLIAIAMRDPGAPTRVSGPSLGSYLTFATIPGLKNSAPGQLTIKDLKKLSKNIILIGGRGVGKTAIAQKLSSISGKLTLSTDDMVTVKAGIPIPEITSQHGWEHFREIELEVLKEAKDLDGIILDCGGGIICDQDKDGLQTLSEEKIHLLKEMGTVFWIQAPINVQANRIKNDPNRPSITGKKSPQEEIMEVMALRAPWYAHAADHAIDGTNPDLDQTAKEILEAMAS